MVLFLANPRGFCAGVHRAVLVVEEALKRFPPPLYVRHEIVHNKAVVQRLKNMGVCFIEHLSEVPNNALVIFSAHGVPNTVYNKAKERKLNFIDATCPLVRKVHFSVKKHSTKKKKIILIGHQGHPEVIGTMGQGKPEEITLIETTKDVQQLPSSLADSPLVYTTQTTLSVIETKDIITALKKKFPHIEGPTDGDLCYATTNRQKAVMHLCKQVDLFLIVGSENSSNSNRLVELARSQKIPAHLVPSMQVLNKSWFSNKKKIGISSGASAPESSVKELIAWLHQNFRVKEVKEEMFIEENVKFPLPLELRTQNPIKNI